MLKRLQIRFVMINMLIVTVMLGVIFGLIYHFTKGGLEQNSITMMQGIAVNPFQQLPPGAENQEVQLPYFTLQVDGQGELVATGGGYYDLSGGSLIVNLIELCLASPDSVGVLEEYRLRFLRVEGVSGYLLVFADISSELATLNNLICSCAVIGALSFFAFLLVSILLAKWAIRPVAAAWQQQRQFVADASHELKTPLTVISTNAEIVLNPSYDDASHRRCAESILAMSVRMRALVESLLNLARADRGREEMLMERLDFGELLKNAVLPYEAVFYERGLKLVTGIQSRIYIKGSARHLEEVAAIRLDNAQKYALCSEPVYLKLWKVSRSRCRFTVSNASEPLSGEQLKDIFKRFYRVEKSRSGSGSYGLGLSIAESVVKAHKGKIRASYEAGAVTFTVELPVCRK
ncbi:MAG: HAMP domain-containing histidine kinase [Lachnospiraceae bacterium]|nr:HAMP domain-containing histidine kinase [Lachnospiraceae bacterium]